MAGEMRGMRVSVRRENDCETATCFLSMSDVGMHAVRVICWEKE